MDPQAERIEEAKRAAEAKPKAQLDTVRDRFSGPYKVKGEKASVPARPQFRINVAIAKSTTDELVKICTKAGIPKGTINNACMGRPTGQQLVRVTQALIDAGKLPAADATLNTTEKRIRQMQHNWGIGVDCAGYVREAAIAVHGNGAQSLVNGENRYGAIYSLLKTNAFKKVAVADPKTHKIRDIRDIRTGDIIHLDSPGGGVVGHNVIVHSHEIATDAIRYELSAREVSPPHELRSFLNRNGPIHVLNVDSSWGVDKGGIDQGGFRRDTWLYDESSGEWGSIIPRSLPDTPIFLQSQDGPYEHIFKGAFRPTSAK
jgi:hypothetical protein